MSYSNFVLKFFNDLRKKYDNAQMDINTISIYDGSIEISVSIPEVYAIYEELGNYQAVVSMFNNNIDNYKNAHKFKLNYEDIYPTIRSNLFGNDEKFPFYRKCLDFNIDLDILFLQDMGETFRFLSVEQTKNKERIIEEKAYANLDKTVNPLVQVDAGIDIYSYKFLTDFNAARILLNNEINYINKVLGYSFVMAIPSTTTVFLQKILRHIVMYYIILF